MAGSFENYVIKESDDPKNEETPTSKMVGRSHTMHKKEVDYNFENVISGLPNKMRTPINEHQAIFED